MNSRWSALTGSDTIDGRAGRGFGMGGCLNSESTSYCGVSSSMGTEPAGYDVIRNAKIATATIVLYFHRSITPSARHGLATSTETRFH